MLATNRYAQEYIDDCRSSMKAQLSAYKKLVAAAKKQGGTDRALGAAIDAFEPRFCNNLVLVLDAFFMHRARNLEGKDGNPVNEVRVLCASILSNGGELVADKQIKLKPEQSVLGYAVGDEIRLSAADFQRLSDAYFAEIESRYA